MNEGIRIHDTGYMVSQNRYKVYLAGPISGLTYEECTDWRNEVENNSDLRQIDFFSPLRGKSFLAGKGPIHSGSYDDTIISAKGITRRDMFDTLRSDAIFVNLLGTKVASIGTVMEIAWAYQNQIPTIVVMEKDNIHAKHVMVMEACTYIVGSVAEGLYVLAWLFNLRDER